MDRVYSTKNAIDFTLFKEGDEKTFECIFNTNYESITGFCVQFIVDNDKAKSIAQQAFIKLWLNRRKVDQINGIRAFLYTAARTECLNYLRHEKYKSNFIGSQIQQKENSLDLEILKSFQFDKLEYIELEELVQEAISKLPEKCRFVFLQSRFHGKKNHEIAKELGVAVKSVESNITRALKALRKDLKDYLPLVLWIV